MSIYKFTEQSIEAVPTVSFAEIGWEERKHLQALLRDNIDLIVPGGLVVSEEYSNWQEGKRRIDLLVVDHERNLVVVELKRTDDGGHMELQALRYAAMISRMTFDGLVQTFQDHCEMRQREIQDAAEELRQWFGPDAADAPLFPATVKVCLVAADFSKEITTTALWLRDQGVDIRCVRFRPYSLGSERLAEIEQVIPPPDTDALIVAPGARQLERRARDTAPTLTLEGLYEALPTDVDRRIVRELKNSFEAMGARMFMTSNGLAPEFAMGPYRLYPLKMMRNGRVMLWFNYLKNRAPFREEGIRRELWDRFQAIRGIVLPAGGGRDPLGGKPTFPLQALADHAHRAQFEGVIQWILEQAKAAIADGDTSDPDDAVPN
jgi:hypothetical protein